MYVQITTQCNMACDHCCMACSPLNPYEHMSLDTFKAVLDLYYSEGGYLSIGGGEPTIHPEFWKIVGKCFTSGLEGFWMATNGKLAGTAMALAHMSGEFFSVALSVDDYHSEIDQRVIQEFRDCQCEIRTVKKIVNQGTATETGVWTEEDSCVCSDLVIKPNGDVYVCSCEDAPKLGTIWDLDLNEYYEKYSNSGCYKRPNT